MFSLREDFFFDISSSFNRILFVVIFSFIDRTGNFDDDLSWSIRTSLEELPASLLYQVGSLSFARGLGNNIFFH